MTTIAVALPPQLHGLLFDAETDARLHGLGAVWRQRATRGLRPEELAELVADADVLVTGWRTPMVTPELLDRARGLRLVAHSAGTYGPSSTRGSSSTASRSPRPLPPWRPRSPRCA